RAYQAELLHLFMQGNDAKLCTGRGGFHMRDQKPELVLRRFGSLPIAASAGGAVLAVPWMCAWAEWAAGSLLLATAGAQALWLVVWTMHCRSIWGLAADESFADPLDNQENARYPCGTDGLYS